MFPRRPRLYGNAGEETKNLFKNLHDIGSGTFHARYTAQFAAMMAATVVNDCGSVGNSLDSSGGGFQFVAKR